jgi:hypothetical protein
VTNPDGPPAATAEVPAATAEVPAAMRTAAAAMRTAAAALLGGLADDQREPAQLSFADDAVRRWIDYTPCRRPGISLGQLDARSRKAAHRLLATGLSEHAYAQAMTIIALEEVLDRVEGWRRGRHSNDYLVVVFGDPGGDAPWGWRFEGHHLSVSATLVGDSLCVSPVFLGANPATVTYAGRPVVRPLAPEEDLARELLDAMGPTRRGEAVVADTAPTDIRSSTGAQAPERIQPLGVGRDRLNASARALLDHLVAVYLARLPPDLQTVYNGQPYFAWEGSLAAGAGHYYRIQADDLLVEYDNRDNHANHAHTVLRRPRGDFGGDLIAAHRRIAHR